jgi:hypothetical protein
MTKNEVKPFQRSCYPLERHFEVAGKRRTYHKAEQTNPGGRAVKDRTVHCGGKSRSKVGSKRDQGKDDEKYNRQRYCYSDENWSSRSWRCKEVWGVLREDGQVYIAINTSHRTILYYRTISWGYCRRRTRHRPLVVRARAGPCSRTIRVGPIRLKKTGKYREHPRKLWAHQSLAMTMNSLILTMAKPPEERLCYEGVMKVPCTRKE